MQSFIVDHLTVSHIKMHDESTLLKSRKRYERINDFKEFTKN